MAFVAVVYHAPRFGVVGADDFAAWQDVGLVVPARAGGYGVVCVFAFGFAFFLFLLLGRAGVLAV